MSDYTHETVPTQFVEANGILYAYRRFGKPGPIPLLFLEYFNSNMDGWDPDVTNSIAADHGLILLGTGPRGGEDMTFTELSAEEQADPVAFLLAAFFSPSEASQVAGREYMKRLESRKNDRDLPVSRDSAVAQLAAIREWGTIPATGRYATLKSITHPTLIVHGNKDIVVTPMNAFILAEHLPNAQLIMYPDSSHGAFYQYRKAFLEHAKSFLSDGDSVVPNQDSIKSSLA